MRDWEDIVLRVGMKHPSYTNLNMASSQSRIKYKYQPEERKLMTNKVDIYYTYSKIMRNIKKTVIRTICQDIGNNLSMAEKFNPILYNDKFWVNDWKASLIINNKEYELKNANQLSPFITLMDISRDFPNEQRVSL